MAVLSSNILATVQFGSLLYGTQIPTSDMDYRSIYLPTREDCFLMRARQAWSEDKGNGDDTSVFSLQHFLSMASQGQSIAIELLAAGPSRSSVISPLWIYLHSNRQRFFTKSMHSFIGYAKTMSGKYSMRIDRLTETEDILAVLAGVPSIHQGDRLNTIWDSLPISLNAEKTVNDRATGPDKRVYRVCGRELQATVTIAHAYTVIKAVYDAYGERVRKAKEGQIEFKSLAHAFRAALQCREIVTTGDLRFPLQDADWLRDLRLGKFNFFEQELDKRLDTLIAEVQSKMDASDLPNHVDKAWLDDIVLSAYGVGTLDFTS